MKTAKFAVSIIALASLAGLLNACTSMQHCAKNCFPGERARIAYIRSRLDSSSIDRSMRSLYEAAEAEAFAPKAGEVFSNEKFARLSEERCLDAKAGENSMTNVVVIKCLYKFLVLEVLSGRELLLSGEKREVAVPEVPANAELRSCNIKSPIVVKTIEPHGLEAGSSFDAFYSRKFMYVGRCHSSILHGSSLSNCEHDEQTIREFVEVK